MFNWQTLLKIVPHYIAMLAVIFLGVGVIRTVAPELPFVVELGVVVGLSVAYMATAVWLGVAPRSWALGSGD